MLLRKILCVDDSQFVHRWQEPMLARYVEQGSEILHAYDGLEALKQLVQNPDVDLILLDMQMPVLNGLAFLEQRRKTEYASIPVIVVSNDIDKPHIVEYVRSLGAREFLAKPFEAEDLHRAIESLVP